MVGDARSGARAAPAARYQARLVGPSRGEDGAVHSLVAGTLKHHHGEDVRRLGGGKGTVYTYLREEGVSRPVGRNVGEGGEGREGGHGGRTRTDGEGEGYRHGTTG